jgi:glycine betaine/proline transport system permease protein
MNAFNLSSSNGLLVKKSFNLGTVLWMLALALVILKFISWTMGAGLPVWLSKPPNFLVWPFADWINAFFNFISEDLGLKSLTRLFASGVEWFLDITANLLYGKSRWPRIGPIPWTVIAVTAFMAGYALRGWKLGILAGGTFVWVAVMGQWKWTMETMSVIVVAAPLAIVMGLLLGILAWRYKNFENILSPILNLAQTYPHFAYMVPVIVFIGVGPKAGAIVTIIFAVPPMVRMSLLGMKKVPKEVIESGQMSGCTKRQLLWSVRVPTARTEILIGVNQVIMQCLAMVVLASFIGMPGLGQKLLQLLQALKIGRSFEIGVTIVLLAITLDRCSKAWAEKQPEHFERGTSWAVRNKMLLIWLGLMAVAFILAYFIPIAHEIKRTQAFSIAKYLDDWLDLFVRFVQPAADWLRAFLIVNILIPLREFYLWLPFWSVLAFFGFLGWRVGKLYSCLVCLAYVGLIGMSSWWDRSMITAYTVSFSVFVCCLIGLPLGIWASANEKRALKVLLICDTAQTFPSFIYLIPVVMLFGVNDVAVIGAVVVSGMVPMARYTIEGLRGVPTQMLEAGQMSGATTMQSLWNIKLPLAVPTIMIGLNQTVMFSLFMMIIAAFIGTQGLGQELQRSLSAADVGKGTVLGLCVAFMGLMIDHMITRWSKERKAALGVE